MENSDITITGSTARWSMPPTIGDLGGTYTGVFEFRTFLDPLRVLQAGREFRELIGSLPGNADDVELKLANILVQLKHRIIKAPPFWTSTEQESGMSGNIGDMNVIGLVFNAAIRAEELFSEQIRKEKETLLNRSIKAGEDLMQKRAGEDN